MTLWQGLLSTRKTLRLHLVRPVCRTFVSWLSALVEHIVLEGPPGAPTSMIVILGPSVVLNVVKPTRKSLTLVGMMASCVFVFLIHGRHLGKHGVNASILLLGPAMVCSVRVSVLVVFAAGKTRLVAQLTLKCWPRSLVTAWYVLGPFSDGSHLRSVIGLVALHTLTTVPAKSDGYGMSGPFSEQLNMPLHLTLAFSVAVHLSRA